VRVARPLAVGVVLLCTITALPATAADGPYDTGGAVLNVLPPGSRGNVGVADALAVGTGRTANEDTPENFADQLEMYDAINTQAPGQIAAADLPKYFKDAPIDLPDDQVVSTESPRDGVTIERDRFGVPFVTGVTAEDVAFGAGWAGTHDRMFLTDLLRHVGAARMAEFLGPSDANIAMDVAQLRSAAYTREEAEAQLDKTLARYPVEGKALLARLDAFVAGINAAQRALCPGAFGLPVGAVTGGEAQVGAGLGPDCPVEYAALRNPPTDFARSDIVYIASLVGGIFGKGGGGEVANARWLQQLEKKYGRAEAIRVFEDLRERNDPEAPTTATDRFPYEGDAVDPSRPGVALPDLEATTAPGTGADAGSSSLRIPLPLPEESPSFGVVDGPYGKINLGLRSRGMSNALLVDAAHSATGHPTVVFGPQTGYFAPQLLTEISLRGPGIAARGVSFTGTQLIVELGHGVDYAWSATSASGDLVDTVAERLCNVDGSAPTVESTAYLVGSTCTPFDEYVHTQTALPTAAGPGLPQVINLRVQRTRHGIVQDRTTVAGKPVALVLQRSTYGQELDSAVGFARVNDPAFVKDVATFEKAFDAVDYTFNWFYVDDRDISYFKSGLLPLRAPGVSYDLPRFGDTQYDWRGFLPFARKPQQTNPPQGYLTSWNNKQAPGFAAADNQWGYGPVYRSQLLDKRILSRIRGGQKVTRVGLVDAMQDAATADLRGEQLLPLLLEVVGDDPAQADALRVLRTWVQAGTNRVDRDRDGAYSHPAAIALFDEWWQGNDGSSVAKEVLRGTLGDLTDALPQKLDDHPRLGLGSAWNGVAWYGYVHKDLRQVLGRPVTGRYSRTYCGGGALSTCRTQLRASLAAATARVLAEQEVTDVSALTYDKSEESIRSVTGGLVGVRPIDWQNRPTFQQVVGFSTHRPRAAAPAPAAPPAAGRPPVAGGQLPATGAELPLLVAVLALALAALLRRRRVAAAH
jgi:acyl-homoserine lactone acylase PvdQ